MAKVSDKKRKQIIADYVEMQNYAAVSRKHGISPTAVRNIVAKDEGTFQLCAQKREENTLSVLEYMDTLSELKKEILHDLLTAIQKKAKNPDMFTNIKDLGTTYGILADKEIGCLN